ncbi:MAG: NAD(P)/FAD-dependent oxidoreductase [Anaerolineae bacterium]
MARRYLIVGMGAGGISAAEAIRSQDPAGEIVLLSDDAYGYYSRPGLAYYLTGEIPEDWLYPFSEDDFGRLRLRRMQGRAVGLDLQAHEVALEDGRRLSYDRLLLATGSQAFLPPLPGVDLEGVVKLDDMADARQILTRARRARAAVVVGGGITALEIVEGLRPRRTTTHYLIRRDRYWGNVLDEDESRIVEGRLQEEGVEIHYHTEVAEILGRRGRVAGVRTEDGDEIRCDVVAIAIGVRPRLGLARAGGLDTDRGVLVDEYLRCSARGILPDVFAAGDVAQVYDPLSGKAVLDTLWGVAVAQGRAAGQNMAAGDGAVAERAAYHKPVPFNVTRLAGLTTTIIGTVGRGRDDDVLGIVRGDSETWRQLPGSLSEAGIIAHQGDFEVNRLRVLLGERTLVGAIVMGDQALSQPLHHLITRQVDITSIRDQIVRPTMPLGDVIAQFWAAWRQRHETP